MPEPAAAAPAVAPQEPLTFATEEEQQGALDKFTVDGREPTEADIAEIDRINAAPIGDAEPALEPAPAQPAEPAPQPSGDPPAEPAPAAPAEPAPAQPPAAPAQPAAPSEEARTWAITEEMITAADENYQDRSGRSRSTITQKSPQDFLKSYVNAQRRIRYLEGDGVSDAENSGYQRAKAESQKVIDDLKAKVAGQPPAAPVAAPAPGTPPAPAQPAGAPAAALAASSNARQDFQATVESLKGMKDGEEYDNVPTLLKAISQSAAVIAELDQTMNRIQTEGTEAFEKFKVEQTASTQQSDATTKQQAAQKTWETACRLVDGFVASQQCPDDLKLDRSFDIATKDAMYFHDELAKHYSGKPRGEIQEKDRVAAVAAYLAGNPQLISRVEGVGLTEPDSYRKWLVLDQVDALRNGYIRDSRTKQWITRHSPDGGARVQFPDMQSSYDEYRRITGQSKADVGAAVAKNTNQIVAAVNQRDSGLVQMDESRTVQAGQAGALGEQEANTRIDELDAMGGTSEALRRARQGDVEMVNQYNAALAALEQPPIPAHLYENYLPKAAASS